ncbi:MAG: hypothetical protein ACYCX2_01230 [Christensenellales bacterium]
MKSVKKNNNRKNAWKDQLEDRAAGHSDHEIGLPESIRVHHNGEANPHDG